MLADTKWLLPVSHWIALPDCIITWTTCFNLLPASHSLTLYVFACLCPCLACKTILVKLPLKHITSWMLMDNLIISQLYHPAVFGTKENSFSIPHNFSYIYILFLVIWDPILLRIPGVMVASFSIPEVADNTGRHPDSLTFLKSIFRNNWLH